jgi:beta-phosphoglucomutase
MALLRKVRKEGYGTGLATMSHCEQASRVLDILGLKQYFDFVATRDDVENGKPDPEFYRLVASQLNVDPKNCLVIEDSATGVIAAVAAKMHCIAVTTRFTRKHVYDVQLIDNKWIVNDPKNLLTVAEQRIDEIIHL